MLQDAALRKASAAQRLSPLPCHDDPLIQPVPPSGMASREPAMRTGEYPTRRADRSKSPGRRWQTAREPPLCAVT